MIHSETEFVAVNLSPYLLKAENELFPYLAQHRNRHYFPYIKFFLLNVLSFFVSLSIAVFFLGSLLDTILKMRIILCI